jgi:hypothetical protein
MAVEKELLNCKYQFDVNDAAVRHQTDFFMNLTADEEIGADCLDLPGEVSLKYISNQDDWYLGATKTDPYGAARGFPVLHALADNNFTIDCWIKPRAGGDRYYPICSSFSFCPESPTNTIGGWTFQIDTATGKLQMSGFGISSHYVAHLGLDLLIESSFTVPMDVWTHVALMSWKVSNIPGILSAKTFFKNGVFDKRQERAGLVWHSAVSHSPNYSQLVLGDLNVGYGDTLDLPAGRLGRYYSYYVGRIRNLRICSGSRFPIDGSGFVPESIREAETTTTTATTQTTTTQTTQTVPPSITIPPVNERDLLVCKFAGSLRDDSARHTMFNHGVELRDQSISGYGSAYFDSFSYIEVPGNLEDWQLGSSLRTDPMQVVNWAPARGNNHFTIDCWVNPSRGETYYGCYPICSSFSNTWKSASNFVVNSGWSFQIDGRTGKLQMIGYFLGNTNHLTLESNFFVPTNEWTHVAVMAWRCPADPTRSYVYFFKNGVPDGGMEPGAQSPVNTKFAVLRDSLVWTNGMSWESKYGSAGTNLSSSLYIGLGPTSTFLPETGNKFYGLIDFLRICTGARFPVEGNSFTPPKSDAQTTQTSTSTTTGSTTRSTTNSTTTGTTQTTTTVTTLSTTLTTTLPSISVDDRLVVRFVGDVSDMTKRHTPTVVGNIQLQESQGAPGGYFDGSSYVKWDLNLIDFALGAEPIVLPQTQSTTTTTGSTTTTQTTASQTTSAPMTVNPNYKYDLLNIGLIGETLVDGSQRHNLQILGGILQLDPNDKKVGSSSIVLDGSSVISVSQNERDWMLGSTKVPSYDYLHGYPYFNALSDNNFTIDCWVKPEIGGQRYYPICSSFARVPSNNVMVGWSFQIDKTTSRLQMVGYGIGSHFTTTGSGISLLIESSFQIPFGEWTHVAVMSWKVSGQAPRLSIKNLFKNGVPDNPNGLGGLGIVWCNQGGANPVIMGEAYTADDRNLGPLSVGSALVLSLPDGNGSSFQFNGKMDGLRISLGPRFRTDGGSFIPEVAAPTTTQTTQTTTLTTTLTTTETTATTQAPQVVAPKVIREFIFLGFDNTLNDATQRHAVAGSSSTTFSSESKRGTGSAVFNGKNTWIQYSGNIDDWILGATPANPWGPDYTYYTTLNDNNFTLDCWIYPEPGGDWRYYGICGSFDHMGYLYSGWFLWLDTVTGKLQMMQHYFGDWKGQSIESADPIPMNTWTHVAVSSWKVPANFLADEQYDPKLLKRSRKAIYINGQISNNGEASSPAYTGGPLVGQKTDPISSQYIIWAGRTFHDGTMRIADFYVGTGGKSQFSGYAGTPEKLLPKIAHFFKGKIDNLRICEGNRYPLTYDYKPRPFDPKDY